MTTNEDSSKWWQQAVVYQVYPQSFQDSNHDGIGDLNGIINKLPYLKKLGVDVLWLNPIYKSPQVDNGYDISNYYELNSDYGTLDDFKHLLDEAHQNEIKIILDLVVNHTSDQHEWFKQSKKAMITNLQITIFGKIREKTVNYQIIGEQHLGVRRGLMYQKESSIIYILLHQNNLN